MHASKYLHIPTETLIERDLIVVPPSSCNQGVRGVSDAWLANYDGGYVPTAMLEIPEGGDVVNVSWTIQDGRAIQHGTIRTPAEIKAAAYAAAAAEASAARAGVIADVDELFGDVESDQYKTAISAVLLLAGALAVYKLTIPCGGYRGALKRIGAMTLSAPQQAMLGTTDAVYRAAIAECGDDDHITEIYNRTKPQPQQ